MIKIDPNKRVVRETTAKFQYADDAGAEQTTEIRVRYYSRTTAELKSEYNDRRAKVAKDPHAIFWNSELLGSRLESLPDLVDLDGNPIKITQEFLDSLEVHNIRAIHDAIEADTNPK